MGSYLEKNIQAFIDIQRKLQEQSRAFYDTNKIGREAWTQFVNMQAPMIQSMMTNYIEQSKNLFVQMQENMQNQTRSMFSTFPFTAPRSRPKEKRKRRERRCGAAAAPAAATIRQSRANAGRRPARPASVGFVSLGCPRRWSIPNES